MCPLSSSQEKSELVSVGPTLKSGPYPESKRELCGFSKINMIKAGQSTCLSRMGRNVLQYPHRNANRFHWFMKVSSC